MTQSDQHITGNKPFSFFQDSEIEDWFKKNHTLSYLKFKSKIEPLQESIYKYEALNSEMERKIDELIEDEYFISRKIDISDNPIDTFLENTLKSRSPITTLLPIITKLINFFFRSGLSLFPIISIYALIHPLIDGMTNTYSISIAIAVFFGFSLSHFSSRIVQSCSSFYWSELRAGVNSHKPFLFLLFACIILLESFMGAYGINYLIVQNRTFLRESVNSFTLISPALFSLINVSYSFGEEMKRHERLKTTDLNCKLEATNKFIKILRNRIEKNKQELNFYRGEYNQALSGQGGLFDYLKTDENSVKSLYGSMHKVDDGEDLTIRMHFDRDSMNSYYELNNHGVTKTFESNNEVLKQVNQIIDKLIPGQQQINEELNSKLTIYESADILNVSIPYVVNLVESGKIPSQRNGAQCYIDLNDLLVYKQASDSESRDALVELAREAQELDTDY